MRFEIAYNDVGELIAKTQITFVETDLVAVADIVYDIKQQKYYSINTVYLDEINRNPQRFILYRREIAHNEHWTFNYTRLIISYVDWLNENKTPQQTTMTMDIEIALTPEEYQKFSTAFLWPNLDVVNKALREDVNNDKQ